MSGNSERLLALQRTLYESSNPTRRYLHCRRRDWVCARIRAHGDVRVALEIGPGSGVYLPALAEVSRTVLALDTEEAYLQGLELLPDLAGRISTIRADARSAPLRSGSIDLLLCSEVIEHVEDSAPLLRAMAELLAPGGTLILTTPQPFSLLELLGRVAFLPPVLPLVRWIYREPVEPTGHINLLGRRQLESQLHAAGLHIVRRDVLGFYLPLIAEFGGTSGQRLLAWLERKLVGTALDVLLWNQCYLLQHWTPDPDNP